MNIIQRVYLRATKSQKISADVVLGKKVILAGPYMNLYGCSVGDETLVGSFVEIQRGASVGDRCKISSHTFICGGVTIEDEVFIGHGVVFINDNRPRSTNADGKLEKVADWEDRYVATRIGKGASIGSNATILGGITIGAGSIVGAGAVVTKDVPPGAIVVGNPAQQVPSK